MIFATIPPDPNVGESESRGCAPAASAACRSGLASSFLSDRTGAAAVEFAIVALPLIGFVLLIFQVAIYHFSQQSLDYATRIAARHIMVGTVPTGATTASGFKTTLLCPNILLAFTCDNVSVNAYKIEATSDAATDTGIYKFIDDQTTTLRPASATNFCLGGPSDYVFIDVTYAFPNFLGSLLSGDEEGPEGFLLRSSSFFRNEPFTSKGATC